MMKLKLLPSVFFVARSINYLSTVSIDFLCSTSRVVTKSFDINQKRAIFQDNNS